MLLLTHYMNLEDFLSEVEEANNEGMPVLIRVDWNRQMFDTDNDNVVARYVIEAGALIVLTYSQLAIFRINVGDVILAYDDVTKDVIADLHEMAETMTRRLHAYCEELGFDVRPGLIVQAQKSKLISNTPKFLNWENWDNGADIDPEGAEAVQEIDELEYLPF